MLMMDERRTRSQWRRECVDQPGRKKRVGYWIIGKRRDELELGCCGLFRFGDRKPVLPTLSLLLSDACRDAAKYRVELGKCVSRACHEEQQWSLKIQGYDDDEQRRQTDVLLMQTKLSNIL